MDYQDVIADLQIAYGSRSASNRDQARKESWKVNERQHFLDLLQQEGKQNLLEVGAGTGTDGLFFQQHGMHVICTDLSPAMVERCRDKGLEAHVADFLSLDFPLATFDALYVMNCLLHVPTDALPSVLAKLQSLLAPGGLFFLGLYGGHEEEGVNEDDWHTPPRFFARHTEAFMRQAVSPFFEIVAFKNISLEQNGWQFQSIILRRGK